MRTRLPPVSGPDRAKRLGFNFSLIRAVSVNLIPILLICSVLVSTAPAGAADADERISAFVMAHSQWIWGNPFRILFMRDPLFQYGLYPLPPFISMADKSKLDRVYFPRTREILVDNYDLMVFHDIRTAFTARQVNDLDYAFREAGMTAMCGLCLGWDYAWEPTILADLLPITEHGSVSPYFRGYSVSFVRDRDPVFLDFLDLGIEKVIGTQYCDMKAEQAATVWGVIQPAGIPWMVSWRPGGSDAGMQWVVSHTFGGWWAEEENPYSYDVATNMIFYSLDMPLIDDIHARREARRMFANLQTQKSIILSMMEWAESFGARVTSLQDRLTLLEADIDSATGSYIQQDYSEAMASLESLSEAVREISDDAVRLKDEALFWVYASEWMVVTSTAIIAGTFVWSLMIRKRMYRPSGVTRLRRWQ